MTNCIKPEDLPVIFTDHARIFVYIAIGDDYLTRALVSAKSLLRHNVDVLTVLFATRDVDDPAIAYCCNVSSEFKRVLDGRVLASKPYFLSKLRHGSFMFLDADTFVTRKLDCFKASLERYAMMFSVDTWRFIEIYRLLHPGMNIPQPDVAVPYYNSGVLLCRGDSETSKFMEEWANLIVGDPCYVRDQLALRSALSKSKLVVGTLPQEYNARTSDPLQLSGDVRILHELVGDAALFERQMLETEAKVNDYLGNRLWDPARRALVNF